MELLVRLIIEQPEGGSLPTSAREVADYLNPLLAEVTAESLSYRIARVIPESELIGRRVFDSDGVQAGERVEP